MIVDPRIALSTKVSLLRLAKACGVFHLCRRLKRGRLAIAGFHGLSVDDEHLFKQTVFHAPATLRRRVNGLQRLGYRSVSLEDGIDRMRSGRLEAGHCVMTFDDGFYSTYQLAAPMLEELEFTATIYVTTYYMQKQAPIFRLVIQYMFWKSRAADVDLAPWLPERNVTLGTPQAAAAMWKLIKHGESARKEYDRIEIARELGRRLDVSYEDIEASRRFSLMSETEVRDLARRGFDIQLHTHRHICAPENAGREVADNRAALEPLTGRRLVHLCYPSGHWSRDVWPVLEAEGVVSAVTCEPGLNDASTPLLALRRFVDLDHIPEVAFEAEMTGFADLIRSGLGRSPHAGQF